MYFSLFDLMCFFHLQLALLGIDLLSALVTRLQDRFRHQVGTGRITKI